MSKTYAFHDHQNKGIGLVRALRELGLQPSDSQPDLFLVDFDGPEYYRSMINRYHQAGAKVAIYPHGATAQLCLDIWTVSQGAGAYLAFSEGQAEVLRKFDFPRPVYVTGWHWCEQYPARPIGNVSRILFAPIHPLGNGFLHPKHADANRRAFENLLANVPTGNISVRLLGTPEANGIRNVPGVEYHQAWLDNSTADMDKADLVVSYGTFGYLAVARGIPTVMYGQDYPLMDGPSMLESVTARSWDLYGDYMRFPVNDMAGLAGSEQAVADWRKLFIGEQITQEKLGSALNSIFSD